MNKILIVLVVGLLFLTSCNSNGSTNKNIIDITSSQAQIIVDDVKNIITENGVELDEQEIYVPIILAEAQKLDSIKINEAEDGSICIEYLSDYNCDTPYNVKNYEVVSITTEYITMEERNELDSTSSELYTKYNNGGNEYYIASEYIPVESCLLINMYYFIDETTYCFVIAKVNGVSDLSEETAESIYNDFQCISLNELEGLAN